MRSGFIGDEQIVDSIEHGDNPVGSVGLPIAVVSDTGDRRLVTPPRASQRPESSWKGRGEWHDGTRVGSPPPQ
jgi:hypothetical protein